MDRQVSLALNASLARIENLDDVRQSYNTFACYVNNESAERAGPDSYDST